MPTTEDVADAALLSLANEKGKFALEFGLQMTTAMQRAFERGIDGEWFTLVDFTSQVAAAPGRILRVFRLTEAGRRRLAEIGHVTTSDPIEL